MKIDDNCQPPSLISRLKTRKHRRIIIILETNGEISFFSFSIQNKLQNYSNLIAVEIVALKHTHFIFRK